MKIRQRSRSFYFLGELLFVILCFALGSVLCVRLFALADAKHKLALDQNQALRLIQPLAERLRAQPEIPLDSLQPSSCTKQACRWQVDEAGQLQEAGIYQIEIERTGQNQKETTIRILRVRDQRKLVELGPIKEASRDE